MGKQFRHYFGLITILKTYYLIRVYKMKNKFQFILAYTTFNCFIFFSDKKKLKLKV